VATVRRRALVCGASKGIGFAVALELKDRGYEVWGLARNVESLQALGIQSIACDFTNPDQLKRLLSELPGDFHVLVCNSGGPASGPLTEAKPDQFDEAFRAHLFVSHLLMQKCLPFMKKENFGRIVTVLSTSVKSPLPNLGVSNVLRAGMAAWAKTLAGELGPFGITVNNVLPGFTSTDRLTQLLKGQAKTRGVTEDAIETEWLASIPARRFAQPKETAQAVAFLVSADAGYINGVNLPVDGGRTTSL